MEIGNNARKVVEKHFNPDHHYEKLMTIYISIIKGNHQ
jgi:hypothetical protein